MENFPSMPSSSRRRYSPAFKASVAIEALCDNVSIADIARKHGLHPNLVARWRDTVRREAASLFQSRELGNRITRIVAERDFLSQALADARAPSGAR